MSSEDMDIVDGVGFLVADRMTCDRRKLYLDTCTTNHTMFVTESLDRIHNVGVRLRQHCNAGATTTGKMGYWRGIKFWVNETGIANLLSVPQLEKDGGRDESKHGMDMVQTLRKNFKGFTKRQVEDAKQARDVQAMMAHPSNSAMRHMVSQTNAVTSCPVTVSDIANTRTIFGPDRGSVRGKSVRQRPDVVRPEYVDVPPTLFERIHNVTLAADVMFVNGLPFFVTLSRHIKLITIEFLPSRTVPML
eukprot:CCRYP_001432-RA/>CCRYP_001432-RA protein AED:0.43 eAED:0.43 QI:0/0/0/1/1/1/2/0/246